VSPIQAQYDLSNKNSVKIVDLFTEMGGGDFVGSSTTSLERTHYKSNGQN